MEGFIEFVKKQGVIGLGVGFVLGSAVSKLVAALVRDIVNPILGLALGAIDGLQTASLKIGRLELFYGDFLSAVIDFSIIALVVYFVVKFFKLDELDRKKE